MANPHQPTPEEQANVLRAIHYLHARVGTWIGTSRVLRVKRSTLRRARAGGRIRRYLALRVAALASVPFEDLLAGKFPPHGTCPHCGNVLTIL